MEIVDLISNVGFPIACVIGLAVYVRELNTQHREEVNSLREAIENNTLVISKLCAKLDINVKEGEN